MTRLEKLTLYLRIHNRNAFVDGIHVHKEILIHMSQLIFYISTENTIYDLAHRKSTDDIQQTFTNTKYGETACSIEYFNDFDATCHVYSLPITFTRLAKITTQFSNIVFDTVTRLHAYDFVPMTREYGLYCTISTGNKDISTSSN